MTDEKILSEYEAKTGSVNASP